MSDLFTCSVFSYFLAVGISLLILTIIVIIAVLVKVNFFPTTPVSLPTHSSRLPYQ
uniref:p6 n=1 Tax=Fig leaf mottle-associated virus 2 TaxID=394187 RepID=D0QET5_9CLOS|nr:p6 [Fig leaf mottle-associated virus 2]